jgi:hypothetical protein
VNYQDIWLNGRLIEKGYRECTSRYEVIREFCKREFDEGKFSVCDIGAASCYFGIRLREDFPLCSVTAFEPREYEENSSRLKRAKPGGVILFGRKMMLEELPRWADFATFDLILALSLLHHVKKDTFEEWLRGLRGIGRHLIAELAIDDSRSKGAECSVPEEAKIIGYGRSHIKEDAERPIILMKGFKA